jgi:hypothetical protein
MAEAVINGFIFLQFDQEGYNQQFHQSKKRGNFDLNFYNPTTLDEKIKVFK